MNIAFVEIKNFRKLKSCRIDLSPKSTVFVGANNSGKTSLISLIKNMISSEKITYAESDIPAKNMKIWIDRVFPLFKEFLIKGK